METEYEGELEHDEKENYLVMGQKEKNTMAVKTDFKNTKMAVCVQSQFSVYSLSNNVLQNPFCSVGAPSLLCVPL